MPINAIIAIAAIIALALFAAWLTWDIYQYDKQYTEDWWYKPSKTEETQGPSELLRVVTRLKGNFIGDYNDYHN